jgi:hypothetical protein
MAVQDTAEQHRNDTSHFVNPTSQLHTQPIKATGLQAYRKH